MSDDDTKSEYIMDRITVDFYNKGKLSAISILDPYMLGVMDNPDEIVIRNTNIVLVIDDHFLNPAIIDIESQSDRGFKRVELARCVCEHIKRVYREEEESKYEEYEDGEEPIYGIPSCDLTFMELVDMTYYKDSNQIVVNIKDSRLDRHT